MTKTTTLTAALLLASTAWTQAAELSFPDGAVLTGERVDGFTSQRLAINAYTLGEVPAIWAEGERRLQAWQTSDSDRTTLQVMAPLKQQLLDQGYDILFECKDQDCGGFDFRFAQDLLPEPDMHVNLGDYRFVSAQRMTDEQPEYIALMVSRNRTRGFLHVTTIGAEAPVELVPAVTATKNDTSALLEIEAELDIGSVLETDGVAVLEDLDFEVGSSRLSDGDFASLETLADYLLGNPDRTISLVGHTDAVGSIDANFRLSKARAASVRDRLLTIFGVNPGQVDAQGVGYLSPVASNLSEDGRSLNRRVEVVLTATN